MFLCLALLLIASAARAQGMFHANPAHTGAYASPGPVEFRGVKWSFKSAGPVLGSPVVADGIVYFGSTDYNLYAIDAVSGQQKWKFRTLGNRQIVSTPAIADGVVYFLGYDALLYALDAATGVQKWTFSTEYERRFQANRLHGYTPPMQTIPDSWDLYASSPAVVNGKVYFGSGDGNVYAVDARSGSLVWKFPTGDVVHASPAVVNGVVYIGSWDSYFYALDAESGQEKWRFHAGEDAVIHNQQGFQSSAAVVEGVVYVGCRDGHVYALDAASGKKKWDYSTSKGWVNGTPAVRDGVLYVGTSDGYRFFALDAKTGRLRWDFNAKGAVFSSAALAGDAVYFGSSNGELYALNTKTGALDFEFRTDAAKADAMKILNPDGGINNDAAYASYFHDYQDMVLAFYRVFSIGAIWSSPAVDNGVIFFTSTDGNLYAIS